MTGVLLVDDEPLVLVGIQSMLKWEDYDAQVVGTARNGAQALELIQSLRPDLVIADIKMPVMDGLKLMETAQDTVPNPPLFILLTSFEEFSFVKEAISRQAVDYLIKLELTQQALLGALRKAQERLAARRQTEPPHRRPPTERFGMQPFYDRFFIRLFNNLFESEEQLRSHQQELGVDFSFDAYAVCYCELPDLTTQSMSQERLMNLYSSTTRMVWETATRFMACYVTPLDPRHFNITFCLSEQEAPIYQEAVGGVLDKVVEVAYNYFSIRLLCRVGAKVVRPMELGWSYYTARLSLSERGAEEDAVAFYQGEGGADTDSVFDMALYREPLIRAFEDQDVGALEQIMDQITDSIRAHPARRLQAMDAACNLLFLCLSQFANGEEIVSRIFENEPEGYRCVYRQRTIPEITDWISRLRAGLVQALRFQRQGYKDQLIRQIKSYIQANLGQRLTLNNVAAVFGFSPSYLSQLFARHSDQTFVEYVNGEKIRAAKEMMREENVKFYEIAERLGFENAFYFSKVFKKIEGCSPREYVQRLKRD